MARKIRINSQMSEAESVLLHKISEISGVPSSELLRRAFLFYAHMNIGNEQVNKAFTEYEKSYPKKTGVSHGRKKGA